MLLIANSIAFQTTQTYLTACPFLCGLQTVIQLVATHKEQKWFHLLEHKTCSSKWMYISQCAKKQEKFLSLETIVIAIISWEGKAKRNWENPSTITNRYQFLVDESSGPLKHV